MIYYDTSRLWGVLFRWHGSALNGQAPMRAFFMAMIALAVALTNHYHPFVVATRNSTAFTDSLTVFNTFLGLIISFRLNSAFTQWRAGMVAMGALSEAAREIVSSGCAYVSTTIKEELKERDVGTPTTKPLLTQPSAQDGRWRRRLSWARSASTWEG